MMKPRPLPVGIQSFEKLRQQGCVYVDKTEHIHHLINSGSVYFLSRPRRFGKSLLITTLAALFQAQRELFEGLWIDQEERWDWSTKYPVVRLDMSSASSKNPQELEADLKEQLADIAQAYDVAYDLSLTLPTCLKRLIQNLHGKYNQQVAVLVDEYDKPIINHLGKGEAGLQIAIANREILRDFYGVLKPLDEYLRFVFVTGVSKFSKVSIFSGLNNLTDLTLSKHAATLLGYTQQELEENFTPHLEALGQELSLERPQLLDHIRRWYDGYRFSNDCERMYNPFSTLLLLYEQRFQAHWFETGSPSFLINLLESQDLQPTELVGAHVSESAFSSYQIEQLHEHLLPLMVQTGYLTITGYDPAKRHYTVDYPNFEVRAAFLENLMEQYSHLPRGKARTDLDRLTDALEQDDLPEFFVALRRVLAGIPYVLHIPRERYYQTVFYLIHQLLGYSVQTEVYTHTGRIDAVIDLSKHTYVFEFKLETGMATPPEQLPDPLGPMTDVRDPVVQDQLAAKLSEGHTELAQAALQQIKDKQYHGKYLGQGKAVTLVGAVFTVNDMQGQPVRQATAWVSEQVQ